MRKLFLVTIILAGLMGAPLLVPRPALAQQPPDFSKVEIKVTKVSGMSTCWKARAAISRRRSATMGS
jgi:hypothetical protein